MDILMDENGHPLPMSSLHLFLPPLRLVSAALWQVVESRTVMDYGLVEEFVVTVLEIVPHLLSFREKVQLIVGLRAQLILELCRCDHLASPEVIQPHLARISNCISTSSLSGEVSDPKVEATVTNFCKMVETLLVDSKEKEVFFQEVFPKDFGRQYDQALQALLWRFLARLEKLIPVPDLREVVLWFSPTPAVLEECVKSVAHPEPLKILLEYHKKGQSLFNYKVQASCSDKDILSALSPVTWMKKSVPAEGCPLSSEDEETEPATGVMYIESQPGRWVLVPDWEVPPKRPIVSSVEVEVEHPEEEEEVTVSRKRPDKKDKKYAAAAFPKTRSGLKPDRIAAMCTRRQLRVLLSRQDVAGLPLPETRTLSLRKGNVLAGDIPFSRKRKKGQKDITGLPLPLGTLAGNVPFSGPVKRKRGRPRNTEKMGETRTTSPDSPETNITKGKLKTRKGWRAGLWRRRKLKRRHPDLASKKEETIVSIQDSSEKEETIVAIQDSSENDRSREEDFYIIPEEDSGKGDETMMEDSRYIQKPHKKSLAAGLPKARKSAPSSDPVQIKKCLHCSYFHREEEKVQQHMQTWHPAGPDARRRKQRLGLASKTEETIISIQDSSETESAAEDFYIIPEESSDDETKMEDSRCTEQPSHKKPVAGLPKARKSTPSSKLFQVKKCRHCPYFYREEEKLQHHMRLWHPTCPRCGKTFIDKLDLEKHLQSRPRCSWGCSWCNREFKSSVDLEEHVQSGCDGTDNRDNRDEDKGGKDGECCLETRDHTYHWQNNSDSREEDNRDDDGECCLPDSDHTYHWQTTECVQQKCRVCYAELSDGIALILHLKSDHIESPFKCFSCGCTFEMHPDLKRHEATSANCISNMRRCPICGHVLPLLNIKRHIVRHLNNRELKCKACPMTFVDVADLRDHLQWSQQCRAKCYDVSESAAEGHSEKKKTKTDQGHSLTGNLGGVNVEEKVHNTRHRESKRPSLVPKHVDETMDKKSAKKPSLGPKKDETRDKKSAKKPSLVPKHVDETMDKKSAKKPSLGPKKDETRDKKSAKKPSLGPKKDETRDKKSMKRPSLVPKKIDEIRDKKSMKRPSLGPKKLDDTRDKKSMKRPSLVPKKVDEIRDKKSMKRPSLVHKRVDDTRDKKSMKRPSLVRKRVDDTRDKKSMKRPSLVRKRVDDTRDKKSMKRPSLVRKRVDDTRDKKSMKRPSLVRKRVDDTRDKKSMKRPSLVPKKVDDTRDKKSMKRPSLVPKKVDDTRDKKSMKRPSLVPKKVDDTRDKKSMKRRSLVPKKVDDTRDIKSKKKPSLVPKKVDDTRDRKSMKRPSLVPKKVDDTRDRKSTKRPSLVPKKVDDTRDRKSKKRPLLPKELQETSHKRSKKRPSLELQETRPKKANDTRHKRSMKRPSLLPKDQTVSKLQQCSECGIVKDSKFDMQRHLKRHYSNGHNKLSDPAPFTVSCDSRKRRTKPSRCRSTSTGEGGNTVHSATEQQPSSDQNILHTEVERESSGVRPKPNVCFKVKDNPSRWGEKMGLYFIRRVDFLTSQPDTLCLLIPAMYNVPEPHDTSAEQSVQEEEEPYTTAQQVDTSAEQSVQEEEEPYTTAQQVDTSTEQSVQEEETVVILPQEEPYTTAQQVDTATEQSVIVIDNSTDQSVMEKEIDNSTDQSVMEKEIDNSTDQSVMEKEIDNSTDQSVMEKEIDNSTDQSVMEKEIDNSTDQSVMEKEIDNSTDQSVMEKEIDNSTDQSVMEKEIDNSTDQSVEEEETVVLVPLEFD